MPINPFAKSPPAEERITPQQLRSRFQQMLDDFNEAYVRMDHAAHICSTIIHDTEKVLKYVDRFRAELTRGIEDNGGTVTPDPTSIEEQVRQFVAPQMQKVEE